MLVQNRIDRYVAQVTANLPIYDRGRASREISGMIGDMIQEHAGAKEPDILDARAVINSLAQPAEMAASWLERKEDEKMRRAAEREMNELMEEGLFQDVAGKVRSTSLAAGINRMSLDRALQILFAVCTVLAVCLVVFGVLALGTHTISTMLPIFLGCVMALVAVAGRGVLIGQN